jgi:hypothetical protein
VVYLKTVQESKRRTYIMLVYSRRHEIPDPCDCSSLLLVLNDLSELGSKSLQPTCKGILG